MKTFIPKLLKQAHRICVLAPHQDDEVIGLGGTLIQLIEEGKNVIVIFTSNGEKGIKFCPKILTKIIRAGEFTQMNKLLSNKVQGYFLDFPDGKLQFFEDQLKNKLEILFDEFQPEIVFLPNDEDWHPDHKTTYKIGKSVAKNMPKFIYEVWSPIRTVDCTVNITNQIQLKKELINSYKSQIKKIDYAFSILGLNAYRAMMLKKEQKIEGVNNYAEAFSVEI